MANRSDATPQPGSIQIPTLVLAGRGDKIVPAAEDVPRCSCCRQTKSWLACSPYRRATAEEVVAGSRLSATIRAFSSSVQRRRRPTPVMTSIRRKLSWFALVVVL